jgi:hypothetical protein
MKYSNITRYQSYHQIEVLATVQRFAIIIAYPNYGFGMHVERFPFSSFKVEIYIDTSSFLALTMVIINICRFVKSL